jgi:hypothetical protein
MLRALVPITASMCVLVVLIPRLVFADLGAGGRRLLPVGPAPAPVPAPSTTPPPTAIPEGQHPEVPHSEAPQGARPQNPPAGTSRVQKPTPRPRGARRKREPEPSMWESRLNLDWLNGIYGRVASSSTFNPDNTVFEIEDRGARTDLNVDYRLTYNSKHKIVLRPRAYSQYTHTSFTNTRPATAVERNRGKVEFTEAFGEAWLLDELGVTVGQQNFQWGPAEFISPSNTIFHFNSNQRSLLWKEKGHDLLRVNWSPSQWLSLIFISEPMSNGDPSYIAEKDFHPKVLVKAELRSASEAQNYLGLTGGTEEEGMPFVGAYFNGTIIEGLSVYSDFRFTQEGFAYFPKQEGPFFNMEEDDRFLPSNWHHLGVYGVRYEQGSWDLRLELINNSRAYSKNDFTNALLAGIPQNPRAASNADRLSRPGLELLSKNYGYISLRIPDLGSEKQFQLSFRYVISGMDQSTMLSSSLEWALGDHWVSIAEGRQSFGAKDSEFTLQESSYAFLGLKLLW